MTELNASKALLLAIAFWLAIGAAPCLLRAQSTNQIPPPIAAERSPNEIATLLLHLALHEAVWGPPAYCDVRQQVQLFGHRVSGFGKFVRAGEGSGKLKLSLQFPAGDSMNTLLQVSDGQRMHTIEDIGHVRKRTIIDLDKVRKRLVITNQSVYDPTIAMYLAIGGQAESLRKLCQQYEWFDVKEALHGKTEVWLLSGRLTDLLPNVRAYAATDEALHNNNASNLLPNYVRVAIGKAEPESVLPYWLHQVEHRRSPTDLSPTHQKSELVLVTEWTSPALANDELPSEFFEAVSSNEGFFEETDLYLPPANVSQSASYQPVATPAATR